MHRSIALCGGVCSSSFVEALRVLTAESVDCAEWWSVYEFDDLQFDQISMY